MSTIPAPMRGEVIRRARNRCEYCGIAQVGQEAIFHIDHILPASQDGPTELGNLAWACVSCSLRKAAKTEGVDPATGARVPLYNPRREPFSAHFELVLDLIRGRTPVGRATVDALQMNRPERREARRVQIVHGQFPPGRTWTTRGAS